MPQQPSAAAGQRTRRTGRRDALVALLLALAWPATLAPAALAQPASPWRPLPDATAIERIGFGSCLDQRLAMPIWSAIVDARPELFLMLGDNVYGDVSGPEMGELKAAYAELARNSDFERARAAMPFMATWDDHDLGLNDASATFAHKAASARLFHAFWGLLPAAGADGGVQSSRIIGPAGRRVQVIMLDTRSFRSAFKKRDLIERNRDPGGGTFVADADPDKTMLGAAQWAWLEAELAKPAVSR